jgi:hypothetical protein
MSTAAFTITIPDWLIDGRFWSGFGIATLLLVVLFLYLIRNIKPF